jgi:hypothetical protein
MSVNYNYHFSSFTKSVTEKVVDPGRLTSEISSSTIITALDYINVSIDHCDIWFKDTLSSIDQTNLDSIVANHSGEPLPEEDPTPRMPDGRPIVRADTRPLNTMTYFTMRGDSDTDICHGQELSWDFSDSTTNMYYGADMPPGYKCKQMLLKFHCPVYLKDGTIYFYDAPWGMFARFEIAVPPNSYYPNPAGNIPAAALGLTNDSRMFSFSGDDIVPYQVYVSYHRLYGTCPMGDELNAEGAAVEALPPGWYIRCRVFTPESDNVSKGYATLEMYRCHTLLLPGQTLQDIIDEH